jgi:hypothetical protein
MKIEAGKYYRTRGGLIVGPLTRVSWCDSTFAASDITWKENGYYVQGITNPLDLISEVYVSDTPPAVQETEAEWRARLLAAGPGPLIEVHDRKTLRDEFAMAALPVAYQSFNNERVRGGFLFNSADVAERAYQFATAMMEARKK